MVDGMVDRIKKVREVEVEWCLRYADCIGLKYGEIAIWGYIALHYKISSLRALIEQQISSVVTQSIHDSKEVSK